MIVFFNCLIGALAALLPWGLGTSSAPLIVFSIVWGLTALSFSSLWTPLITRICQDDPALPGVIFAVFAFLRGIGNFTSGPISTQLLKSGNFKGAVGAYGSTNFVSAAKGYADEIGAGVGLYRCDGVRGRYRRRLLPSLRHTGMHHITVDCPCICLSPSRVPMSMARECAARHAFLTSYPLPHRHPHGPYHRPRRPFISVSLGTNQLTSGGNRGGSGSS